MKWFRNKNKTHNGIFPNRPLQSQKKSPCRKAQHRPVQWPTPKSFLFVYFRCGKASIPGRKRNLVSQWRNILYWRWVDCKIRQVQRNHPVARSDTTHFRCLPKRLSCTCISAVPMLPYQEESGISFHNGELYCIALL